MLSRTLTYTCVANARVVLPALSIPLMEVSSSKQLITMLHRVSASAGGERFGCAVMVSRIPQLSNGSTWQGLQGLQSVGNAC